MGLWIIQQCNEVWGLDYGELYARAAGEAGGPLSIPTTPAFSPPGADMPERVQTFCLETGQAPPQTPAELTRCVLDSLALKTAQILDVLERSAASRSARSMWWAAAHRSGCSIN